VLRWNISLKACVSVVPGLCKAKSSDTRFRDNGAINFRGSLQVRAVVIQTVLFRVCDELISPNGTSRGCVRAVGHFADSGVALSIAGVVLGTNIGSICNLSAFSGIGSLEEFSCLSSVGRSDNELVGSISPFERLEGVGGLDP